MSPTSYQAAPPRRITIDHVRGRVKSPESRPHEVYFRPAFVSISFINAVYLLKHIY